MPKATPEELRGALDAIDDADHYFLVAVRRVVDGEGGEENKTMRYSFYFSDLMVAPFLIDKAEEHYRNCTTFND